MWTLAIGFILYIVLGPFGKIKAFRCDVFPLMDPPSITSSNLSMFPAAESDTASAIFLFLHFAFCLFKCLH